MIWLAVRRQPAPVRRVTASLELVLKTPRRGEPMAAPHETQNAALASDDEPSEAQTLTPIQIFGGQGSRGASNASRAERFVRI